MGFLSDIKLGFRSLVKHPGFSLVAIVSLALGIGANTAIFSLLNAILLRPLPVRDPETLVAVFTVDPRTPGNLPVSYLNFKDYRDRNSVFSALALYVPITVSLTGQGEPSLLMAHLATAQYFPALGINLHPGRGFLPEEDATPGAAAVAVISDGLWQRVFASDPAVLSKTIELNGRNYRIIGVAPPGFQGVTELYGADVWIPFMMYPQVLPSETFVKSRRALVFSLAGRLKPGVSAIQAEGQMQNLAAELERQYPRENLGRRIRLAPVAEASLSQKDRTTYSQTGNILLIVSGLVLLVACANVANLLLARAAGRAREISVRLALGASRWQLIRRLLIESCLLSFGGGLVGLFAAAWLRGVLWSSRPPAFKYARFDFGLDYRMLAYTLGIAVFTGLLFGLWPAFRSTKPNLAQDLKERSSAPGTAVGRWSLRSLLVVFQVALSLVALIGAGLFVRSLRNADTIDPGFDVAHVATISFNGTNRGYDEVRGREFERQAVERAAAIPGVSSVALARDQPLLVASRRTVMLPGQDAGTPGHPILTSVVGPGYLKTVRIPLLRGRDFSGADTQKAPKVAIVNEVAGATLWPGQDPVGKVIEFAGENLPVQVVGVARVANYQAIGERPQALIYLNIHQYYSGSAIVYIRGESDLDGALAAVRKRIQALDPNLLLQSETVRFTLRQTLWAQSLSAGLLSLFGGLAMVLAALGIYGVISYSITLRTREFGVRTALGASPTNLQLVVVSQGIRLVAAGVTIGLGVSLWASRLPALQSMLLVTSPRDALTFILAPAIMTLIGVLACWFPARRATHIDPAIALRDE